MDSFKLLPEEIELDILTRVPADSVVECKFVSKAWNNIVHHPSFSKMHSRHLNNSVGNSGKSGFIASSIDKEFYYFEYDENHSELGTQPIQSIRRVNLNSAFKDARYVGSCNGLMCSARGPSVWICNPITRECVLLPEIKRDCDIRRYRYWTIGFGYLSSTNEYKIVGLYTAKNKFVQAYIYTLGSGNGWRNLGKFNIESNKEWDQAVFADGALYWLDDRLKMIITFDLAEEKFCEHLSPPPWTLDSDLSCRIGVLDGFLYMAVLHDLVVPGGGRRSCFGIWLLKKTGFNREMDDQEDHQSFVWNKVFMINKNKLLSVTKSDGVLTEGCYDVNFYNKKTSTSIRLMRFNKWLRQVSPHKNTVVSLKELEGKAIIPIEAVEIEETARSRDYADVTLIRWY